jgi:hypothetical protein
MAMLCRNLFLPGLFNLYGDDQLVHDGWQHIVGQGDVPYHLSNVDLSKE